MYIYIYCLSFALFHCCFGCPAALLPCCLAVLLCCLAALDLLAVACWARRCLLWGLCAFYHARCPREVRGFVILFP